MPTHLKTVVVILTLNTLALCAVLFTGWDSGVVMLGASNTGIGIVFLVLFIQYGLRVFDLCRPGVAARR